MLAIQFLWETEFSKIWNTYEQAANIQSSQVKKLKMHSTNHVHGLKMN